MTETGEDSDKSNQVSDGNPKSWNAFSKSGLILNRILGNFSNGRRIACLCQDSVVSEEKPADQAVVILEKLPIAEADVTDLLASKTTESDSASLILANDIYYTFHVNPHARSNLNRIKATVIKPATEQHISKYLFAETAVVTETPELYTDVTKPYILQKQLALRWVQNIIDGTAEADRVLYSDPDPINGFVLLPDMKWDGVSDPRSRLYLVAIIRRKDLFSLRDLTGEHLPLLERIASFVPEFIQQKFGIPPDRLRVFFHYLPSYWHLHIHFVVGTFVGDDSGLWSAERAHFLSTVIANIRLMADYYQRATLLYSLRTDHPLHSQTSLSKNSSANKNKNEGANGREEPETKVPRVESS